MNWLKQHWFLVLCLLILAYALLTAQRWLAFAAAGALTLWVWLRKLTNPVWLIATALAWLLSLLWGSSFAQKLYQLFTGKPANPPLGQGTLG